MKLLVRLKLGWHLMLWFYMCINTNILVCMKLVVSLRLGSHSMLRSTRIYQSGINTNTRACMKLVVSLRLSSYSILWFTHMYQSNPTHWAFHENVNCILRPSHWDRYMWLWNGQVTQNKATPVFYHSLGRTPLERPPYGVWKVVHQSRWFLIPVVFNIRLINQYNCGNDQLILVTTCCLRPRFCHKNGLNREVWLNNESLWHKLFLRQNDGWHTSCDIDIYLVISMKLYSYSSMRSGSSELLSPMYFTYFVSSSC